MGLFLFLILSFCASAAFASTDSTYYNVKDFQSLKKYVLILSLLRILNELSVCAHDATATFVRKPFLVKIEILASYVSKAEINFLENNVRWIGSMTSDIAEFIIKTSRKSILY